jgi:hypothetical protein
MTLTFAEVQERQPEEVAFALFGRNFIGCRELYCSDLKFPMAYRGRMNPTFVMTSPIVESLAVSEFCARVIERAEGARVERQEEAFTDQSRDQDRGKGATEQTSQNEGGNTSMQGQLGHRDEDAELKHADSHLSG